MSDSHTCHEKWLSLLKDHLEKERYSPKTTLHCMGEATKFLTFIAKQSLRLPPPNRRPSSITCDWQMGRIADATATRLTMKAGDVHTPMASTCFCA